MKPKTYTPQDLTAFYVGANNATIIKQVEDHKMLFTEIGREVGLPSMTIRQRYVQAAALNLKKQKLLQAGCPMIFLEHDVPLRVCEWLWRHGFSSVEEIRAHAAANKLEGCPSATRNWIIEKFVDLDDYYTGFSTYKKYGFYVQGEPLVIHRV